MLFFKKRSNNEGPNQNSVKENGDVIVVSGNKKTSDQTESIPEYARLQNVRRSDSIIQESNSNFSPSTPKQKRTIVIIH